MKVSKLAQNLIGSEIVKIGNEVNDLKAKGEKITNLTIGDLDSNIYPIPNELKEGIQQAYADNLTNYPPASGILSLRENVSKDLKQRYALEYSAKDILIAGGSRPLIYATFKTIVDEGDKVIYPVPSWNNNHYSYLNSAQKVELEVKPENNFLPTAEELRPHLKDAVLLALCSPLNPTGTMFSEHQLREICELIVEENRKRGADEKPLYLMYDQIYAMLTFGEKHFNPVSLVPEMKPYTIFIDGSSKCFAATGVRVGWAFGPLEIIGKMAALLTHVGAWAPKPEQQAMAQFLTNTKAVDTFVNDFKGKIKHSLETLHEGIQALKQKGYAVESIRPMGALYLTIQLDYVGKTTPKGNKLNDTTDLVFYLIKEAGMALVPFSAFGNSRTMPWFRASAGGCSLQDIKDVLPRLEKALSELK
ncbi:pyridoxal phosphate-dependent aminotransferase [Capnocytophaga canimorsus]|uniref:pyridoxal phosphate-dependent aminotransferase n=1 Tax=Capnocytophaga canimorsus TaxID=28188 RepID=UPI001EE11F51|nr:aminotransferase class I/II-fold pyridoxal phosphate-dependent enzyme [Capnocytophaga canimorsus]GJQ05800.1 aminotransferase [Capnocytophaga canimorsus]